VTRIRTNLVNRIHPDLLFWMTFLGLNFLLFLPLYLLNVESTNFLPLPLAERLGLGEALTRLMVWRANYDLFRINLEVALLAVIWVNVAWIRRPIYRIVFLLVYFITLSYYIYESIMLTFYAVEPVFYSEYMMAQEGIPFLLSHLGVSLPIYAGVLMAVMAVAALIVLLTRLLLDESVARSLTHWSRVALLALIVGLAGTTLYYRAALAQPEMVVSSLSYKLQRNVAESLARYEETGEFDARPIYAAYDYADLDLAETPNIYLIFVESYGSVLYKRPDFQILYTELAEEMDATLRNAGWQSVSGLSLSPTWGGGSWMAYTSALFGLRIDHHPYFQMLFKRFQTENYPDLGDYLRSQGYSYNWLTSLSTELKQAAWDNYERFYGTDTWLKRDDLEYVGQEYAWGPAPPDQYALNFARQHIKEEQGDPHFLFFITQTSHYPWTHLPELVEDWQTLNVPPDEKLDVIDPDAMEHSTRRANYMQAIEYEMRMLVDFILSEDSDAIFILVGDHQPPRVSRRDDGFQTPIHVIARDDAFLDEFKAEGFVDGWTVPFSEENMHHEGLYSLLVHALVSQYGEAGIVPPDYLPYGVEVVAPELEAAPESGSTPKND
jgi:phosphoglycerol transferase MdoB-like AlkP superfamily enzyme